MSKPSSRAEAALDELCVRYGYCVPVDEIDALLAQAPENAEAFLDAPVRRCQFHNVLSSQARQGRASSTREAPVQRTQSWSSSTPHCGLYW